MKTLREIMRPSFRFVVQPTATVAEAVRLMKEHNVGIVAVLDRDALIGVFSERDVARRVVDARRPPERTSVAEVMTTTLVTADAEDDYRSAMRKMDEANIRHLPVMDGGRLVSMLSIRDLMRVEIVAQGEELRQLQDYLYSGR